MPICQISPLTKNHGNQENALPPKFIRECILYQFHPNFSQFSKKKKKKERKLLENAKASNFPPKFANQQPRSILYHSKTINNNPIHDTALEQQTLQTATATKKKSPSTPNL